MSSECYKIYGLIIKSELPFPHWPSAAEETRCHDVLIKVGAISRDWDDRTPTDTWFRSEKNRVFIRIENVGRFLITEGNTILYEPSGEGSETAWLYVEGAITGAVLHQRQIWPLHGSCVLKPDGTVAAFVGQRGIGKSTLLFEMQKRGYPVVADDIAAISFDVEGRPHVNPGFPQGKLCADAVEHFGLDVAQLRSLQNLVSNKFAVRYDHAFVDTQRPLSEVICLDRHDQPSIDFCELAGLDKLRLLSDNTYRLELLSCEEDYQRLFRNILKASCHVHAYRLKRPAIGSSVSQLASFIEGQWK